MQLANFRVSTIPMKLDISSTHVRIDRNW